MSKTNFFIYTILLPALLVACHNKVFVSQPVTVSKLRVLGYLPGSNDWSGGMNAIDLTQITDLNLAFINPDADGNFPANDAYRDIIKKAHDKNVRVFLSIGGGNPPAHLEGLMESTNRANLIAGLVAVAETYGFDGVDVDLENSLINANYAPFVRYPTRNKRL